MTETVFKFLGKFYHKISVKMSFLYFSWLALCKKCLSGKILVLELWIKKVLTNNIAWFSKFNIFLQWFFGWWCNTMRLKGQQNCQKLLLLTICKLRGFMVMMYWASKIESYTESSPPRKIEGRQFYPALEDLKFLPTSGGLAKWGV